MRHRVNRTVQLAKLGKDLALYRRRGSAPDNSRRLRVIDRLARLHGLPQKIGQILSLAELSGGEPAFTRLAEAPDVLSPDQAYAEVERALGRPWRECFSALDPHGISASLARVYRARLHDGREAAVKIQYPEIAEALETDLAALGWLTAPLGGLRRGFDLAGYRREVGQMLRQELDYRQEADMIRRFRPLTAQLDCLDLPVTVDELCGEKVLVMTWIEGKTFASCRNWPPSFRRHIGGTLLSLFLESLFSMRMVHADPHPGNYRFRLGPKGVIVGLLDFGCVKTLDPNTTRTLATLIDATIAGTLGERADRAETLFEQMGFDPVMLQPMRGRLADVCSILFQPFLSDRPFDLSDWRMAARMDEALGELRWNFRMSGPPDLIYFIRAYQGLIQYLTALAVPVNWRAALENTGVRCAAGRISTPRAARQDGPASTRLRIQVIRNGRTKVQLVFPAATAEALSDLIPPEIEPQLASRNIDVPAIARGAASSGFAPCELFHITEGADHFRVWLE